VDHAGPLPYDGICYIAYINGVEPPPKSFWDGASDAAKQSIALLIPSRAATRQVAGPSYNAPPMPEFNPYMADPQGRPSPNFFVPTPAFYPTNMGPGPMHGLPFYKYGDTARGKPRHIPTVVLRNDNIVVTPVTRSATFAQTVPNTETGTANSQSLNAPAALAAGAGAIIDTQEVANYADDTQSYRSASSPAQNLDAPEAIDPNDDDPDDEDNPDNEDDPDDSSSFASSSASDDGGNNRRRLPPTGNGIRRYVDSGNAKSDRTVRPRIPPSGSHGAKAMTMAPAPVAPTLGKISTADLSL